MALQTQSYRELVRAFVQQMRVLGYSQARPSAVRLFLGWLERQGIRDLNELGPAHGKAYYRYLQERPSRRGGVLSPHTINGYLAMIRLFLTWLHTSGRTERNAFADLRFAAPPVEQRTVLSRAQLKRLYGVCERPRERLLLGLFYGCGLRRSEAERLNLADVDARSGLLYVRRGKGGKRRVVPLTERVIEDIKAYVWQQRPRQVTVKTIGEHGRALVLNRIGRRMSGQSYYRLFGELKARTGDRELLQPGIGLHTLRHSIATHLLRDGMPIERVRDFLGHDCLESTQIYTRIDIHQL